MTIKLLRFILSYTLILTVLSSCESMRINEMVFLGDSLIAKWDVSEDFPVWITENLGKSGCSVSYLDKYAGMMYGKNVTILVGTNDITTLTETNKNTYEQEYLNTILSLHASHIYLFSILPRRTEYSDHVSNSSIKSFNTAIKERIKSYPEITYIDAFDDFMDDSHIIATLYEPDGLHINNNGYAILKEKLISVIQK